VNPAAFDPAKLLLDANAEGMKRALEILTAEQRETWKKLIGAPVAFPLQTPGRSMSGVTTGTFALPAQAAPGFQFEAIPALPAPPPAPPGKDGN
jgi:hypothetical protein